MTLLVAVLLLAADPAVGDSSIRRPALGSEIVIKTSTRTAGAIDSLTWNGKELIDRADHGRELQSASDFDDRRRLVPEVFNPTEAGSMHDGAGPTSTSRLLKIHAEGNTLETSIQMAFWLRPGEKSAGHPARNTTPLSDHILTKRVTIGDTAGPNVIQDDVTFTLPEGEHHTIAQFEALTGYMPEEFHVFWHLDPKTGTRHPLSEGPGEQADPVIVSTEDGAFAMGIVAFPSDVPGMNGPSYGRFRFASQKVNKWNCVYRLRNTDGVPAGDYRFRTRVVVGTLEVVTKTMRDLINQ